ncbi:hypothetical protein A2U01_0092373, partial [Trifolium medium]|nr:hypothetical protein [Trifolium medium]
VYRYSCPPVEVKMLKGMWHPPPPSSTNVPFNREGSHTAQSGQYLGT